MNYIMYMSIYIYICVFKSYMCIYIIHMQISIYIYTTLGCESNKVSTKTFDWDDHVFIIYDSDIHHIFRMNIYIGSTPRVPGGWLVSTRMSMKHLW